jgi:hypothetical protein
MVIVMIKRYEWKQFYWLVYLDDRYERKRRDLWYYTEQDAVKQLEKQ